MKDNVAGTDAQRGSILIIDSAKADSLKASSSLFFSGDTTPSCSSKPSSQVVAASITELTPTFASSYLSNVLCYKS